MPLDPYFAGKGHVNYDTEEDRAYQRAFDANPVKEKARIIQELKSRWANKVRLSYVEFRFIRRFVIGQAFKRSHFRRFTAKNYNCVPGPRAFRGLNTAP